jgi:hypothetical protein
MTLPYDTRPAMVRVLAMREARKAVELIDGSAGPFYIAEVPLGAASSICAPGVTAGALFSEGPVG